MSTSPPAGSAARTLAAGVVTLLGYFAILCTVFGAIATFVDWRESSPNVRTDLQVLALFACAAAVLIPLGRFMAAREKPAPPAEAPADGHSLGAGLLSGAVGLYVLGMGTWRLFAATHALGPDDFMFAPAGSIFVFAGVQLALPVRCVALRHLFGALLMTAFAITFGWVAFGPGERHFTGSLSVGGAALGIHPGAWLGRALFGIVAIAAAVPAVVMWVRWR